LTRLLVPLYALSGLLSAVFWPLVVLEGALSFARLGVCICFVAGAALCLVGEALLVPRGPTLPAILALSLGKSAAFLFLGIAFLLLVIGGSPSPVNAALLLVYAAFGGAAGTCLFTGLYTFFGRGRGWIGLEAFKYSGRGRAGRAFEEKLDDTNRKVTDIHEKVVEDEEPDETP
jgi:hypothetical protein